MTEQVQNENHESFNKENSIYETWQSCNKNHPDLPAIEYFGNQWSFKQCEELIDIYARAFLLMLPDKKKSVTFCTPSLPSTFFAFYALNKIGVRANFVSHTILPSNPNEYIEETDTEILVLFDGFFKAVAPAIKKTKLKKIIIVSLSDGVKTIPDYVPDKIREYLLKTGTAKLIKIAMPFKKIMSLTKFESIGRKSNFEAKSVYNKGETAVVLYTGGSTGIPKGVEITNEATNHLIETYKTITSITPGDRNLVLIPPNHPTSFMISLLMPWRYGATQVIQPIYRKETFADDLINTKAQIVMAAPSHYAALLLKDFKAGDLRSLRSAFCGGEPVTKELAIAINNVLEKAGAERPWLGLGYGMSELGPTVFSATDETLSHLCNKVGSLIKGVEARIIDNDGNVLGNNEKGRLEVRTPYRMKGYYKQPELTAEFFNEDGFAKTGDIAICDENGYYDVIGRATDSITAVDGSTVYLFDIERVIYKDNAVWEAEVIGLTCNGKDVPVVHIVLNSEYRGNDNDVILRLHTLCKEHLSANEIPQGYKIREVFGTNPISAKRDYRALLEERNGYFVVDGNEVREVEF
ncbi:MAG: acyl--CoA ligase [Oscillospiraceae bacterium]|nr:acyl--CoA ligase [Oscillospiraceae bacterium]